MYIHPFPLILLPSVVLGLALTGSLTQVVKITVGRPRPGDLTS
jgi:hypothetical protein